MLRDPQAVTLLVVPTDRDVEQMTSDARFFWGAPEVHRPRRLRRRCFRFRPFRSIRTRHDAALSCRGSARPSTPRCGGRDRPIDRRVGCGAVAAREFAGASASASVELRLGTEIEPQRLADLLADAGFSREDPVDEHGAFAVRGGIVDVFPAADSEPVRVEFVGDMVETLRRFDPATQRSTGAYGSGPNRAGA